MSEIVGRARAANTNTSANANVQKLARFLRGKLQSARRLELLQVLTDGDGDREARVDAWPVNGSELVTDIAAEVEATATSDALSLGGVNVYALVATDGEGKTLGRCAFRAQGDTGAMQITPNERPTMIGMRAQEMRHNELCVQLAVRTALDQIDAQRELYAEARAEMAELRAQLKEAHSMRIETIGLFESLVSEKAKRDLEAQREIRHERMQAEILSKVGTLWPLLVHKLAGGKGATPGLAPGAQDLLSHLLANVSREEIQRMASTLPPEKQILLWEVIANLLPRDPVAPTEPTNGAPS